ncbi:MAG TPA: hypothetical protein VFT45_02005 [Longimicrobium sp.]|nr:hypothetical protein [Longimicrobium sp.]
MDSQRVPLRTRLGQRFFAWLARRMSQLEGWARRTELRKGTRVDVHGLAVVMHEADPVHSRACLDKVTAALDVVAEYDPRSLEAMRSHFSAILVWSWMVAANGSYLHSERLCMLWCDYVEDEDTEPARIAMTLIHELTHAKHARRARRGRPMDRAQAEWLCIGAELAFIRKVPETEHLRRAAAARLERRADFYSPAATAERKLEHLEDTGGRRWAAFLRFLQRRRQRRQTAAGQGR